MATPIIIQHPDTGQQVGIDSDAYFTTAVDGEKTYERLGWRIVSDQEGHEVNRAALRREALPEKPAPKAAAKKDKD